MPLPKAADGRIVPAVDVSNWLRSAAPTSEDRLFWHVYGRGDRSSDQFVPGWRYSFVTALETGRTSWTTLLDAVPWGRRTTRPPSPLPNCKCLVTRLVQARQWQAGDPEIWIVMDSGYDVAYLSHALADLPVVLVVWSSGRPTALGPATWLTIWTDLGRAPRTIDAYARGPAEYLLMCEREAVDAVTRGRHRAARHTVRARNRPLSSTSVRVPPGRAVAQQTGRADGGARHVGFAVSSHYAVALAGPARLPTGLKPGPDALPNRSTTSISWCPRRLPASGDSSGGRPVRAGH
ncbi:transposase [Streptomyces niphimycinicus]|uniref:transposase n=1 Tax=Streptomyces niphimycinicus TaxID=2842201 RepID=UPI0035562EF2